MSIVVGRVMGEHYPFYPIVPSDAIKTDSGRYVYRHSSNKGCVLVFDRFGRTVFMFFADAAYRSVKNIGCNGLDLPLPNMTITGAITQSGNSISAKGDIGIVPDNVLQQRFPIFANDLTMKELCDVWMSYSSYTDTNGIVGSPAVSYCRSTLTDVFSGGCDLPDMYSLCAAYIEGDTIDSIDPTVDSYLNYAMGKNKNPRGHGCFGTVSACDNLWSSSEHSQSHSLRLHYIATINTDIGRYYSGCTVGYGICPAKEL